VVSPFYQGLGMSSWAKGWSEKYFKRWNRLTIAFKNIM